MEYCLELYRWNTGRQKRVLNKTLASQHIKGALKICENQNKKY